MVGGRRWMKERSCFKWDLSAQFSWNHLLRNLKLNAQGQKRKKTTIKVTGWLSSLFSIHLWSEHKRWDICSNSSGINYMLIVILQLIIYFMTMSIDSDNVYCKHICRIILVAILHGENLLSEILKSSYCIASLFHLLNLVTIDKA